MKYAFANGWPNLPFLNSKYSINACHIGIDVVWATIKSISCREESKILLQNTKTWFPNTLDFPTYFHHLFARPTLDQPSPQNPTLHLIYHNLTFWIITFIPCLLTTNTMPSIPKQMQSHTCCAPNLNPPPQARIRNRERIRIYPYITSDSNPRASTTLRDRDPPAHLSLFIVNYNTAPQRLRYIISTLGSLAQSSSY